MKKTSISSHSLLLRIIFVVFIFIQFTPAQTVHADGAPPPEPNLGGAAPYQPIETKVQMISETVLMDVLPSPTRWTSTESSWNSNSVKVSASFTLRNQGTKEEKMQVIFPLTRLDYSWVTSSYNIIESSFVAIVNGKPVPTSRLSTPPELQAMPDGLDSNLPDGFFVPDVQWAGFDVVFPVHEDVLVQVEYEMQADSATGLHQVDYILETGAGWYGRILSADIIMHLPYPATRESISYVASGCMISGNEVRCQMKDFEPKRKDNLTFGFMDTNEWSPILELRSRVEQYPDDADAWYKLGDKYYGLGFWSMEGHISVKDKHMADLSVEAFERAVALRPEWGDAHLALARALWFNAQRKLTIKDSAMQWILLHMQLAASSGIHDDHYYYDELASKIRSAVPDLEPSLLPVPIKLTSVTALPTATPAPIFGSIQKVVAMAAGNYHTCVLTVVNEVKCRGLNFNVDFIGNVTALVAGDLYTCMLTTSGGVQCIGRNNFGQLGDGTTTDRDIPVDVIGLTSGVSALVAGDNHTCALMLNGGVKCWGRNYFGQLGNGTTAYSLVPVDVNGLTSGVASLMVGSDHTCALMMSGGIKCWGANEAGQLGDGSLVNQLQPVDITSLPGHITELAAGYTHTCALDSVGQVLCWGSNDHGQLGVEDRGIHTLPVIVLGLDHDIVKLAAGNGYSCALTSKGGVKCWGWKQLYPDPSGNGVVPPEQSTPYDVDGLTSDVVDLVVGNNHISALLQNGRVVCWGWSWYCYSGSEAQFGGEPTLTPPPISTIIAESFTSTPVSLPITALTETSSPTIDFILGLILLIAISVLVLLLRRSKRFK